MTENLSHAREVVGTLPSQYRALVRPGVTTRAAAEPPVAQKTVLPVAKASAKPRGTARLASSPSVRTHARRLRCENLL